MNKKQDKTLQDNLKDMIKLFNKFDNETIKMFKDFKNSKNKTTTRPPPEPEAL